MEREEATGPCPSIGLASASPYLLLPVVLLGVRVAAPLSPVITLLVEILSRVDGRADAAVSRRSRGV